MILNDRIYLRYEDIKPAPFVQIDLETLKEIKQELSFDEKELKTIQWKEDEKSGRILTTTPLITDGNLVYVIARYNPKKDQSIDNEVEAQPKLVVEAYDPQNQFKFVSEVTLIKNQHLEQFYKKTDMDIWLRKTKWASNGKILACFTQDKQARFFSLKSGMKLQKLEDYFSNSDSIISYNYSSNQFSVIQQKKDWHEYADYQIPGFKKIENNSSGDSIESKIKKLQDQLLSKPENQIEQQRTNVIDQLIHGIKLQDLDKVQSYNALNESISKEQLPRFTRSLILNFLNSQTEKFKVELLRLKDSNDSNSIMQVFRFPFVSYLTSTAFTEFTKGMKESIKILDNPLTGEPYEIELKSIEDFLKVLNSNFEALGYCSIDFSSLFVQKAEYEEFMNNFQILVGKLSSQEGELSQILSNLKDLSKQISEKSMTLIVKEPEQVLTNLKEQISQGKIEQCTGQIKYLTSELKLKALLQGKFNQQIRDDLTFIFKEISKHDGQTLQKSLELTNLETINEFQIQKQSQTSLIYRDFLVSVGLEIQSIHASSTDHLQKRLKSSKQSAAAIEAKSDLKKNSQTLSQIFEICIQELINQYSQIIENLQKSCESKKVDSDWEGIPDKFKLLSETVSYLLMRYDSFYQIINSQIHALQLNDLIDSNYLNFIFSKSIELIYTINKFYKLWIQFGEKLGIDKTMILEQNYQNKNYHSTLQSLFNSLRRSISWSLGLQAYKMIKIETEEKEEEKEEEGKEEDQAAKDKKKKENDRKLALQTVIQSNLLSGGVELYNLSLFTQESQEKLSLYAQIMDDKQLLSNLGAENKKEPSTDEVALTKIIYSGRDADVDLTISFLQKILEKKIPRVPFANIGGQDGLTMTRAAFALMIRFGDLLEDFNFMVDQVAMQAADFNDLENPDNKAQIIDTIKQSQSSETIIKRWENASKMRQWINEKKLERSEKREKQAIEKMKKEKILQKEKEKKEEADKEEEKKDDSKKEEEKKEESKDENKDENKDEKKEDQKEENQIDSSAAAADESKKKLKEGELTAEEKQKAIDDSYSLVENDLQQAFKKIQEKANFLIKLQIPHRLKRIDQSKISSLVLQRLPTTYKDAPQPKSDWEGRLKTWKQIQTTQGAIKSQKDKETENQNSGVSQILSLLQSSIWAVKIQEQVEKSFMDSCKRAAGLKMIRDLIEGDFPYTHLVDIINWFCSALRQNKNKMAHYLDDTKGQGQYLELRSKKYFFDIIGLLINKLKNSNNEDEIKFLLNSLKWSYTARDHHELASLQFFKILHKGNNTPDNLFKKAWGRSSGIDISWPNEQKLSKSIIDMFEHLFLTVTGRVVESDSGESLKLQKTSSGTVHTLQKSKSVIDENVSEILLGQAFEIIFREFERYRKMISSFDGIDWASYVRTKNQERFEKSTDILDPVQSNDEPLYDEIEGQIEEEKKEQPKEEKPEENSDKIQETKDTDEQNEEEKKVEEVKQEEEKKEEDEKKEGEEKKETEEKKEEDEKKEDEEKKEGEDNEDDKNQVDDEIKKQLKERQEKECKKLLQLYSEQFLLRLIKLVEIFTSIANSSSYPLSMVQKIANPYHLSSLLHLLLLASPSVKVVILKIIQNIIRLQIPNEIFEEAIRVLTKDNRTLAYRIINNVESKATFSQSIFLKFLYNLCLSSRQKIWSYSDADSDGSYAVTQIITQTLRIISSDDQKSSTWGKEIKDECLKALQDINSYPIQELDTILCLIAGGEYGSMSAGSAAITNKQELVTILGYSSQWQPSQTLIQDDKSKEEYQNILKSLKLTLEFTDPDQMAVCLFYDKNAKQHQEMLLVAPSNLSPVLSLDQDQIQQLAQNSPLKDPIIFKNLLELLQQTNQNKKNISNQKLALLNQKLLIIIKIINSQIEILGESYIDFLQQNDLLQEFISFLLKFTEKKDLKQNSNQQVLPINWIESKLVNIRKTAIESDQSIHIDRENIQAYIFEDKEIIFRCTNSVSKNTNIINCYLTSAVNLYKIKPETVFNCFSSQEQIKKNIEKGSALKCGLVPMKFEEFKKLDDENLKILSHSEAVIINQPEDSNIQQIFVKLIDLCKKDAELPEWKQKGHGNILETVILFVNDQEFPDLSKLSCDFEAKEEDANKTPLDKLLDALNEWGGLDKDLAIQEIDLSNIDDIGKVMQQIKEGRIEKQKQDDKFQEQIQKFKQSNQESDIKKLEEEEKQKQEKYSKLATEKNIQIKLKLGTKSIYEQKVESNEKINLNVNSFTEFQSDPQWFEELEKEINSKIVPVAENDEGSAKAKKKSDKQMTKLLWSTISNFDQKNHGLEHLNTVDHLFKIQIGACLINILRVSHQSILKNLTESKQTQESFAFFLKSQFNQAVLKLLQSGQKNDYTQFKLKFREVLDYCSEKDEFNNFLQFLIKESIINSGIKSAKDIRQKKATDFIGYFSNELNAINGLNPYLLIVLSSYLIKSESHQILQQENCISTLISIHLCMAIYFQKNQALVRKLLKSSLKLIKYCNQNIEPLYKAGELQKVVLIKLINSVTSKVDYNFEESKKFTIQQILFLELHLTITDMCDNSLKNHNLHIGSISHESESICQVRKQKQILREQGNFDLVRYLYFLSLVDEDIKNSLTVQIRSSKPAFKTMNRAFIDIKEVSRTKLKYLESNKLKDFSYFGISNDPNQDMTYKSSIDKEFDWASGSFYIFYPVITQCLVGFGYPSGGDLGSSYEGQFPVPSLIKPPEDVEVQNFRPQSIYGQGEYSFIVDENGQAYFTGNISGGGSSEKLTKVTGLKKKIINATVGRNCIYVILEDNTIWYMGDNQDCQIPSSKSSFTEMKFFENKKDEEKFVDISSGFQTSIFVTESGKLYIRGKTFLTLIDQVSSTNETVQIKLPENRLCRKAWVSYENSDSNFSIYALLEDPKTGHKSLYSAGKSEKGALGLGENIKESRSFQKVEFRKKDIQIQDLSAQNQSVICYDESGDLWAWGLNESYRIGINDIKENGFFIPQQLYLLNSLNLKPKKISCGQIHSLILFQDQEGKEKLYSLGLIQGENFKQLGVSNEDQASNLEETFREIKIFEERKVLNFITKPKASIVVLQGPNQPTDPLYVHKLPENKTAKGLLHFYKKDDKWQYITEQDYESQKQNLPALSFAIKCPINNLETLAWPELDKLEKEFLVEQDQIIQEESNSEIKCTQSGLEIKGPLYHSKSVINDEDIEVNYSEKTVLQDDKFSVNPLIFYRITRPLIKGAELPKFNLAQFYGQESTHHLNIDVVPDLSFQKNSQLIGLSQDKWKEICENDEKFDHKYEKELLQKIDAKMQSVIENKSVLDLKPDEDLKVGDLDLQDKGLQKLNEKIKKQKIQLIMQYNQMAYKLKSLRVSALRGMKDSIYELFQDGKNYFLSSIKNKIINNEINNMSQGGRQGVRVRRQKAQKFKDEEKCDHSGTMTIFGQIFQQIKKNPGLLDSFKMNTTDSQMFSVEFVGEGSIDAGGPFRETMTNLATEIESEHLPLFIKTPNNKNDHGNNRDCYILNPASNTPTHAELFKMFGYFLGFTLRTKHAMNFHFPPLFWKQLLNEEITLEDFEGVDAFSCQILKDMQQNGEILTEDYFDAAIDETFQTFLSNGVQVELCPGGKDKAVNKSNHKEFIELVKKVRFQESEKQLKWVKEGVQFIIDLDILNLLSWDDIELRACGLKEISVEKLQEITEYRSCEKDSAVIKMFWEMFGNFTQQERSKYLKFVWGRSRMPLDTSQLRCKHQIQFCDYLGKEGFPIAHTCFFTLDMPPYADIEIMTKRFKYAIENCADIDADFNAGDRENDNEEE